MGKFPLVFVLLLIPGLIYYGLLRFFAKEQPISPIKFPLWLLLSYLPVVAATLIASQYYSHSTQQMGIAMFWTFVGIGCQPLVFYGCLHFAYGRKIALKVAAPVFVLAVIVSVFFKFMALSHGL